MAEVRFEFNQTTFVWDSDKEQANIRNHGGITFEHAATAFFDPFIRMDDASRNDEARDAVIGYDLTGRLLFVVHVEFEDEAIRIISARKASATERELYDS